MLKPDISILPLHAAKHMLYREATPYIIVGASAVFAGVGVGILTASVGAGFTIAASIIAAATLMSRAADEEKYYFGTDQFFKLFEVFGLTSEGRDLFDIYPSLMELRI